MRFDVLGGDVDEVRKVGSGGGGFFGFLFVGRLEWGSIGCCRHWVR